MNKYVSTGLSVAAGVGLAATIAKGAGVGASTAPVRIHYDQDLPELPANMDVYIDLDAHTGAVVMNAVEQEADAPTIAKNAIRLAKVQTGAASIAHVQDLRAVGPSVPSLAVLAQLAVLQPIDDGNPYAGLTERESTNYVTNPRAANDVTGWESDDPEFTITRDTTVQMFGAASVKIESSLNAKSGDPIWIPGTAPLVGDGTDASDYAAGLWWIYDPVGGTNVGISIRRVTSEGVSVASLTGTSQDLRLGWNRLTIAGGGDDLPVGDSLAQLAITDVDDGATIYVGGAQLEVVDEDTEDSSSSYFDGDMGGASGQGFRWLGTAHASASERDGGSHQLGPLQPTSRPHVLWDDGSLETMLGIRGKGMKFLGLFADEFPTIARRNDIVFRTDIGTLFFWSGTRWEAFSPTRPTDWPAFMAYRDTTQSGCASSAFTKVRFTEEEYDESGEFAADVDDSGGATESRFVASIPGLYHFAAAVRFLSLSGATNHSTIEIRVNGSAYKRGTEHRSPAGSMQNHVSTPIHLEAGDYVEVFAFHDAGVDEDIQGVFNVTWFSGYLVYRDVP